MAATLVQINPLTFDANPFDLTAATGGNSFIVGDVKTDWQLCQNGPAWGDLTLAEPDNVSPTRKRSGNGRIQCSMYTDVPGDPLPTLSASGATTPIFTHEALDALSGDLSGSMNAGLVCALSSSRINGGQKFVMPLDTSRQSFRWLSTTRNGQWRVTASLSDASASDTYDLPTGAINVAVPGWFEVLFQGTWDQVNAGVTLQVKVNRETATSATGNAVFRGILLIPPTPAPRPRGMFVGRK